MKLFIIHGWAYDTSKWEAFILALRDRGLSAKLLKVPGLSVALEEVWDINDYVAWLKKEIGTEPAALIGHSNGGRIALHLAADSPSHVKHLILIDSAGVPLRTATAKIRRMVFGSVARVGKKLTSDSRARQLLYKVVRRNNYLEATPVMREVMSNMLRSDYAFDPTRVNVQTDIIWGSDDTMTPLSIGQELKSAIDNSKMHIINGARHSPQYTHPIEVADIVAEVLS